MCYKYEICWVENCWFSFYSSLHLFFTSKHFSFLPHPVNTLLNVKLSEAENGKLVSILDLPGNILIIPQATLGGKVKGRSMQYHSNSGKEEGLELYSEFVSLCEKELAANSKCAEAGVVVEHGTYGNRQVFKLNTNGPYTHLIEFWEVKSVYGCFLVWSDLDNRFSLPRFFLNMIIRSIFRQENPGSHPSLCC